MDKFVDCDKKKVLFLTNNDNTLELYEWLKERTRVDICRQRLALEQLKAQSPELIISYNYKYMIPKDVIEYMQGKVINLHCSYLPWNRGAYPNFWSFFDDTPKGVTIHQVSEELDKGLVLYQKECFLCAKEETFGSSYERLQQEIVFLFQAHWEEIIQGDYRLYQQKGKGSYHSVNDLKVIRDKIEFKWTDNVAEFLKKYNDIIS